MTVKNGNSDHIACNRFESIRDEEGMERMTMRMMMMMVRMLVMMSMEGWMDGWRGEWMD